METFDNRPIGVFDSGLGGLTAVVHMASIMPKENFIYFGDTARTPYGAKSAYTIKNFAAQISDFIVEKGAKIIVIACNTVSATCISFLRERHPDIPIIGMIGPAAKVIAKNYGSRDHVGIIGTKVTVESRQYEKAIRKYGGNCRISSKACPLFVPVIEEGITRASLLEPLIKYYLDDLIIEGNIDTIVLGCTHYSLIEKEIRRIYPDIRILDPSRIVAEKTKEFIFKNNMNSVKKSGQSLFYASDFSPKFIEMTGRILQSKKVCVERKNFDENI